MYLYPSIKYVGYCRAQLDVMTGVYSIVISLTVLYYEISIRYGLLVILKLPVPRV